MPSLLVHGRPRVPGFQFPGFQLTHRAAVICSVAGVHLALAGWAWQASPALPLNPPAPMTVLQWVPVPGAVHPASASEPAPAATAQPQAQRTTPPRAVAAAATTAAAPSTPPAPEADPVPAPPTHVHAAPSPAATASQASAAAPVDAVTLAGSPGSAPEADAATIPSQSVQYLVAPLPRYPAASRRLEEAGQVLVQVWVSEAGLPQKVQVHRSSGFQRLDAAAVAAVEGARFKPYVTAGRPTAGWTFVPLSFDLENS